MEFSIQDFLIKRDQYSEKLWIWSHLLKKSSMENFFCAVLADIWIKNADVSTLATANWNQCGTVYLKMMILIFCSMHYLLSSENVTKLKITFRLCE